MNQSFLDPPPHPQKQTFHFCRLLPLWDIIRSADKRPNDLFIFVGQNNPIQKQVHQIPPPSIARLRVILTPSLCPRAHGYIFFTAFLLSYSETNRAKNNSKAVWKVKGVVHGANSTSAQNQPYEYPPRQQRGAQGPLDMVEMSPAPLLLAFVAKTKEIRGLRTRRIPSNVDLDIVCVRSRDTMARGGFFRRWIRPAAGR